MSIGDAVMAFGGPGAIIATVILLSYPMCLLYVLFSGRSEGGAKFGWFLLTLFFWWVGLAIFLILTQRTKEKTTTEFNRIEPGLNDRERGGIHLVRRGGARRTD
jgi:hypothetical protein